MDVLKPLGTFLLFALMLLGLSRLGLVAWQWDRVSDAGMLQNVLVQGLRFDIVVCGLLFLIPVLTFPLAGMGRVGWSCWRGMLGWYLPLGFALLVLGAAVFFYYNSARRKRANRRLQQAYHDLSAAQA